MGLKISRLRQHGSKLLQLADQVRSLWSEALPQAFVAPLTEPLTTALHPHVPAAREFSPNPGELTLHSFQPHHLPMGAPLVVLLHGCGQDPEHFATESGWRALALRHHFALLMPGQTEENNRQRCFNWFRVEDFSRGHGEAASIVAMVEAALKANHGDRRRVFITGLSAGGAMTANLLAGYPDLFAAGAVVAGLPAGASRNMVSAMTRMAGRGAEHDAADWASRAQHLAPEGFSGQWPRLSIWHGQDDNVVAPQNGAELALQFATLHGESQAVTTPVGHEGSQHTMWGKDVELWSLAGGQHVYPPHAATEIARFFGIIA